MPNKDLVGKRYKLPAHITKFLIKKKKEKSDGFQMASNVLEKGYITYEHIKKLLSKEFNEYENDWFEFEDWCEDSLSSDRMEINTSKKIKDDSGISNAYRKERTSNVSINEGVKDNEKSDDILINGAGFIIHNRKVLLLKRGSTASWMPDKWACVGGGVEKGETAKDGFEREVMEETNLLLDKVRFCYSTQEDGSPIYFFIATAFSPNNVKINFEHSEYMWFTITELKALNNTVPNLYENAKKCIKICLDKKINK